MHQPEQNEEGPAAPDKLVTALKRMPSRLPFIPPTVDETVLRAARRRLQPKARQRLATLTFWRWAAAAVAVCVLALALVQINRWGTTSSQERQLVREDINRDGRVDILDAFALARKIKAGSVTPGWLDVNGDGVVDERDVTAVAAHAVQLSSKGGRS